MKDEAMHQILQLGDVDDFVWLCELLFFCGTRLPHTGDTAYWLVCTSCLMKSLKLMYRL